MLRITFQAASCAITFYGREDFSEDRIVRKEFYKEEGVFYVGRTFQGGVFNEGKNFFVGFTAIV